MAQMGSSSGNNNNQQQQQQGQVQSPSSGQIPTNVNEFESKIEESEDFKIIKENMKGGLGNKINVMFHFGKLLKLLTSLAHEILNLKGDLQTEDRLIIEKSAVLILATLCYQEQLAPDFF